MPSPIPVSKPDQRVFRIWTCLLLSLALGLSSCALFNPGKGLKSCRYTYRSLAFASVDKDRTYWTLDVGVVNPNIHPVTLEKMRFALLHGKDTLLTGWNPAKKGVPAGDSMVLQTQLELPHAVMQRLPPSLLADPHAEFTLVGDAFLQTWVGEMHVPDALKKTIHVNMPEQVARVRDLFMQRLFPGFGGFGPKPGGPPNQPPPESGPLIPGGPLQPEPGSGPGHPEEPL